MAKAKEKVEKEAPAGRDKSGRFVKGQSGNPRGRAPLPPDFKDYAKEAPARLRAICDDPATPVKVKADIERWFAEMWYGKSPQALDLEGKVETLGTQVVKFEGVLDEWSK